tara:strand:- start:42145 stop:44721 length:2577 start_codon:yes stop_codon:yes gene_type:complete
LVNIIVNGKNIDAEAGKPLVEVLKENGFSITNLCYIDGLDPYAGCRTCVVEIKDAKPTPMQLSCTTSVAEGMVINTESSQAKEIRQSVMSFITTNHPDRCLTCHRRVHCQPGEICLRDDVVTHRCLTCAKNYRCELQTATELVDLGEWQEPWVGEDRSYYETPPPKPDRANPFLEFDPQMCILCTRCVRACADIRHTGAISLAGKGFETKIAFGAGGAVHESNCDFCGACIDVCPTATLMEKPNKWSGLSTDWSNSVCNGCSMNCTISYGISDKGEPVIVRPVPINQTSQNQICVRGRFGYSEINIKDRLASPMKKENGKFNLYEFEQIMEQLSEDLTSTIKKHGANSIGIIASPFSTNEDAALLNFLANKIINTNNLDYIDGENYRAVIETWEKISKVRKLNFDTKHIADSKLIIAVATDLEESHQITSLRIKDAVMNNNANLIVISPKWNELVPFAKSWIQIKSGEEAKLVEKINIAITQQTQINIKDDLSYIDKNKFDSAVELIQSYLLNEKNKNEAAIVFAHPNYYLNNTKNILIEQAQQIGNLASLLCDEKASQSLYYLPNEANIVGLDDMKIRPNQNGKSFYEMLDAIINEEIKCLIVHADNPLIRAINQEELKKALSMLENLIVIDSAHSTISEYATYIIPDKPFYLKSGTTTNVSSYVFKHNFNQENLFKIKNTDIDLYDFVNSLNSKLNKGKIKINLEQYIRSLNNNYSKYPNLISGISRTVDSKAISTKLVSKNLKNQNNLPEITILAGKTLFTSRELTSINALNADPMEREQKAMISLQDAEKIGLNNKSQITITKNDTQINIDVDLTDRIAPGTIFIPQYYDSSVVLELFDHNQENQTELQLNSSS